MAPPRSASQPTLTRRMASLEESLRVGLFRRSGRIRAVLDFLAEELREDKPLLDVARSD